MDQTQGSASMNESNGENGGPVPENVFLIVNGTKAIPITEPVVRIGRSHDNTLVLDDPRISRHHAEIRLIRDHFVLFDLGSSGGTFLNGQRTSQGILYPGDLISLANLKIVFMQGTHLPGRSAADSTASFKGPGQRPTVVFNTSIFRKRHKGWDGSG